MSVKDRQAYTQLQIQAYTQLQIQAYTQLQMQAYTQLQIQAYTTTDTGLCSRFMGLDSSARNCDVIVFHAWNDCDALEIWKGDINMLNKKLWTLQICTPRAQGPCWTQTAHHETSWPVLRNFNQNLGIWTTRRKEEEEEEWSDKSEPPKDSGPMELVTH